MKAPIPIYLAVEDELSECVARRTLAESGARYSVGPVFGRTGSGYLKRQTPAFNHAAQRCPFLLLTDLDRYTCPPELIADWLPAPRHEHLLVRVAVREVESWLLGDAAGLGTFLGLRSPLAVSGPESLKDPKQRLLEAALRCPRRSMREALVWRDSRSGRLHQGPDYNGTLAPFVRHDWDVDGARRTCRSLGSLFSALARLEAAFGR